MDMLLAFALPAGLFLALELLWCRPSWSRSPSGGRREREQRSGPPPMSELDLFSLPFVRGRLDVLAAELDRLECDEAIFARAFRYRVAKSAYEDLLADASRLAEVSRLAEASRLVEAFESADARIIEIEIWGSPGPLQEELEV
jgi:hypothetical protein